MWVWSQTTVYVVFALITTLAEPLDAPPVEKFAPDADVLGDGQLQVIVVAEPMTTLVFKRLTVGG